MRRAIVEIDAAEIRIRAEHRLGELLIEQRASTGLNAGGRPRITGAGEEQVSGLTTLEEIGVDRKLSSRAPRLAAMPKDRFEATMRTWRREHNEGDVGQYERDDCGIGARHFGAGFLG